jgi:hypothetical protein
MQEPVKRAPTLLFRASHFPILLAKRILQNSLAAGKMNFPDKINA